MPVRFAPLLFAALLTAAAPPTFADGPARKTVLLIAGADDDHPPGTHDYERTVAELATLLKESNVGPHVAVETALGWPADPAALDRADCVFLYSAGGDHDESNHPLLVGDRWDRLEAAAGRGCGVVLLHWATFLPDRLDGSAMTVVGGRFDYEGGAGHPQGWESRIDFAEAPVTPATPGHPALAGVERFTLHDEFYHRLRVPDDRTGWTPLLTAPLPTDGGGAENRVVAWALERAVNDGGPTHRAVGFTGGHFTKNLPAENYHRFLLNAVTWAAGVEVPVGGVRTFDELWTPADRVGSALPYELEKEKDWYDGRVREMNQGPWAFNSIELPGGEVVPKAVVLRKPDGKTTGPGTFAVVDTETALIRCSYDADRMLDHSDRRFGLIDLPSVPADATEFELIPAPLGGWTTANGDPADGDPATVRYVGLTADGPAGVLHFEIGGVPVRFDMRHTPSLRADTAAENIRGPYSLLEREDPFVPPADPAPRWSDPLVTAGARGEPIPESAGAFAVDTIALPFDNPHKALLYLSGLDFTPDGTAYVAAAHGDVWQVRGLGGDLSRVEWRRFATGLYQPLGLKVRPAADGTPEIFVLGRDRITKLVDVNGDGEADRYESFNADLDVTGRPHAYAMGLETDAAGNFYFLKSGRKGTEQGGCLVQVTADGAAMNVVATGFRHPNGVGVSPDGLVTAADNEGNWVPATPLHRIDPALAVADAADAKYYAGYVPTAHREEAEAFDRPILWMPRAVCTSAGGQVWVPSGDRGDPWGPLAGAMLHLSFGRCTANLVLTEPLDGPGPSAQGAAMALPGVTFEAGVCRGRFFPGSADLWVCGLDGWQTAAVKDGCLQRLRRTDKPLRLPTAIAAHNDGLELRFAAPLDDSAADPAAWRVEAWTYRRSADYGSQEFRPSEPTAEGHDLWPVAAVTLSPDRRGAFLSVPRLEPVMQYSVAADLTGADGANVPVRLFGTLHDTGTPWSGWK